MTRSITRVLTVIQLALVVLAGGVAFAVWVSWWRDVADRERSAVERQAVRAFEVRANAERATLFRRADVLERAVMAIRKDTNDRHATTHTIAKRILDRLDAIDAKLGRVVGKPGERSAELEPAPVKGGSPP